MNNEVKRRWWRKSGVLLLVLLSILAFGAALPPVASAGEKVLRIAQQADCNGFDPQKITDVYTGTLLRQVYNGLVQPDENMVFQPDLAESWENTDALTWVFRLRQGVLFHNGEEFTAEDVKYTFDRIFDPKTASPGVTHVREIDRVEVVDKYTVKITTKTPYAPLLASLGRYELSILNKKGVEAAGSDYNKTPVGTGPFTLETWRPGDRVVLKKFDGYFRGEPKVDRLVFRGIPEDATRVIELESGGVDICMDFPAQDFERVKADGRFVMYEKPAISTNYYGFNVSVKPFDDRRVRQALNYAVDIDALIDALFFGTAVRARGPLSDQVWGFDETLPADPYPYNPEKARALLAEAGYPNGFKTKLYASTQSLTRSTAEFFQGFLAEVGVEAEVVSLEWGAYLAETRKGVDGMFTMGWSGTGDADGALTYLYDSQNIDSSNRVRWNDPRFDKMMYEGRTTLDPEKRRAIYKEAQSYFNEEVPIVLMYSRKLLCATTPKVRGFAVWPNQVYQLFNVSIED
ncbi:MAG: glutathione ABC transporter substrate-binding protein [Synergistaceae bacterium]|jgi:peptide/nickel transport system substrate-binding protein|nr:glutathione ABC transporter substrate-binding protein [Synergistaceae bacterium]